MKYTSLLPVTIHIHYIGDSYVPHVFDGTGNLRFFLDHIYVLTTLKNVAGDLYPPIRRTTFDNYRSLKNEEKTDATEASLNQKKTGNSQHNNS